MKSNSQDLPSDPKRVRAFANFFKRYMSISAIITAALPIPITSFQLIPTFSIHTKILSVYTSLFCFLTLAFIFFNRHKIARLLFSEYFEGRFHLSRIRILFMDALPALMMLISLICLLFYHYCLEIIFSSYKDLSRDAIINDATILAPGESTLLIGLYLGIFIAAESAFILMAIKEYLQDLQELSDMEVILGVRFDKSK